MKTRPGAIWTAITGTLVLPMTIALVTPVQSVAQTRGSQTSSPSQTARPAQPAQTRRTAQPTRPPQPAAAPQRTTAKVPAGEDAKPATGWTKKTAEGQPDLQGFWSTSSSVPMISGPEGRIPPLSEEGQKRQAELAANQAAMRGHEFDQAENRALTERCILGNSEGPPVISPGYNSNLQIIQGEGYVMILQEMIHDARLIPLDNRPHLSSEVTQWFGDSRGHWEGDTLVVETTNYNGRNPFQRISSGKLKVTERFTRLNGGTLQYEFTIDDPVWTRPWTAVVSWAKTEGPLFEYACHEGNYGNGKRLFLEGSAPGASVNTNPEQ